MIVAARLSKLAQPILLVTLIAGSSACGVKLNNTATVPSTDAASDDIDADAGSEGGSDNSSSDTSGNSSTAAALASFEMTNLSSSMTAGVPFAILLTARDGGGSVLSSFTGTVTLTSSDGAAVAPTSYTFTGSDAGVYTFSNLEFRTAGNQTITLTSGSVSVTSNAVTVAPGAASQLTFSTQPVAAGAAAAFTTPPVVQATDAYGNNVAAGATVTLAAHTNVSCTNAAGGALSNASELTNASGVATFSTLEYDTSANIFIKATSGAATACSTGVSVGVAPSGLSYTGSPYVFANGAAISSKSPSVTGSVASYSISPDLNAHTGLTFNTSTGVISGTPTSTHAATTYNIVATNPYGTDNVNISVETGYAPSALSYTGAPFAFITGNAIASKSPTVTNGGGATYAISPDLNAQTGLDFDTSTGVISGTPSIARAATTYSITATNTFGSSSAASVSITTGTAPATLSYSGSPHGFPLNVALGSALTPNVTGGTPTSYSVSPDLVAQTGLTFNTSTGAISGTPTITQAATTYTITGTNAFGSTNGTISIETGGAAPSALSYTNSSYIFAVGSAIASQTPTVTGTVASYSISPDLNSQTGLTFNTTTGVISGTPNAAHASTSYTITATNAFGSDSESITIETGVPPSSLSYTGSPFAFALNAAITDKSPTVTGTVTSYSINHDLAADTGLAFSTSTGVISGTPSIGLAAKTYTITATNTYGSTQTTVSIAVSSSTATITVLNNGGANFTTGERRIVFSGSCSTNAVNLSATLGGVALKLADSTCSNATWATIPVVLASGANSFSITAEDGSAQQTSDTITATLSYTAPAIEITQPTNAGWYTTTTASQTISGTCSPSVTTLSSSTGDTITNDCAGSGTWTMGTTLASQGNVISITADTGSATNVTSLIITYCSSLSAISAAGSYAGGDGTVGTPYLISTPGQLQRMNTAPIAGGMSFTYFKLSSAIDLSCYDWKPIGGNQNANPTSRYYAFEGSFDGDGYGISNLYVDSGWDNVGAITDYVGLFGYTGDDTVISNISVVGAYASGVGRVGILSGHSDGVNSGTGTGLSNVNVWGTVASTGNYAGLLIGYFGGGENAQTGLRVRGYVSNSGTHTGCVGGYMTGTAITLSEIICQASGTTYVGGLGGEFIDDGALTSTNVIISGSIAGTSTVGGVAGYNWGADFTRVASAATVTASSAGTDEGALFGSFNGWWPDINQCLALSQNSLPLIDGNGSSFNGSPNALKTAANLKAAATYTTSSYTWDLTTVWDISEGNTLPWLR